MLGIIVLITSWIAAYYLLKKVTRLKTIERIAGCVAVGTTAIAWVGFILFLVIGLNNAAYVTAAIVISVGVYAAYKLRRDTITERINLPLFNRYVVLLLFTMLLLISLFYTHMLQAKSDGFYSGGYAWGDIAFHLSITNNFLNGPATLTYNVFNGAPLGYPFIGDFLTALLAALGSDCSLILFFTGASLAVSIVLLFYRTALRLLNNRAAAALALVLLLLNGGLGFYYLYDNAASANVFQAITSHDYANLQDKGIYWTNFITGIFLPMRTALFGIALFFTVFLLLDDSLRRNDHRTVILAGILTGSMPLLHTHSFLVATGISLFKLWGDKKKLTLFFALALPLAAPQVLFSSQQVISGTGFLHILVGWMSYPSDLLSWLRFWIINTSIALPLVIVAWWKASERLRKEYLPWALLFVIGNVVVFQPYDYDNIKLFFFWYAFTCILIAGFLMSVWNKSTAYKTFVLIAVVMLTLSGTLSVVREATLSRRLYDTEEIALGTWTAHNTPRDAIFLTSAQPNHFVSSLAGRNIVMGYRGWLWSHGFNYSQRQADVQLMYLGGPHSLEPLQKYNVTYAVIGPSESTEFRANKQFFEQHFEMVQQTDHYTIYKI